MLTSVKESTTDWVAYCEELFLDGIVAGDDVEDELAIIRQNISRPRNEEELRQFVWDMWGVKIPDVQVCPQHVTPWRAFHDAFFCVHPTIVIKASRAFGGKTFLLSCLSLTECVALEADVNILGGSGSQSRNAHKAATRLWAHPGAPTETLKSDPSTWHTFFKFGNELVALTASQGSVRGPHPQRLRLDEIDEMDIKILDASLGQPMEARGIEDQVVMSSTHQYADGTMSTILERAVESDWPVYEWCWRESMADGEGWLTQKAVKRKQKLVTKTMWTVEFDLQEPSPESRAIEPDKVSMMFKKDMGYVEDDPGVYYEFEAPVPGGIYAHGADWARKQDWTVIITFRCDVEPFRVVAYERVQRQSWPSMVKRYDDRVKRYGTIKMQDEVIELEKRCIHDGTGIGDVIDQYMETQSEGFIMAGRKRADLLSEYVSAIEDESVISPFIKTMEKEHRFATQDHVFGAGHLPDTISAGALAYRAAKTPSGVFVG